MNPNGPEYAYTKGRRAHRSAVLIVAAMLVAIVIHDAGVGFGIRYAARLLFPGAGIWFADELAEHVSASSSGWFDARNAPRVIRTVCWFCFAMSAILLIL